MKKRNNRLCKQTPLTKSPRKEKNSFLILLLLFCFLCPIMIFLYRRFFIDYVFSAIWTSFFISFFLTLIFFSPASKSKSRKFKPNRPIANDDSQETSETYKILVPGHTLYNIYHSRE